MMNNSWMDVTVVDFLAMVAISSGIFIAIYSHVYTLFTLSVTLLGIADGMYVTKINTYLTLIMQIHRVT